MRWLPIILLLWTSVAEADTRRVFWYDYAFPDAPLIQSAELDGSDVQTFLLLNDSAYVNQIEFDPQGRVCWAEAFTNVLRCGQPDGTNVEVVIEDFETQGGLAFDASAGKVYYSEKAGNRRISRANLDGSDPEPVFEIDSHLSGSFLTIDRGRSKIYWTQWLGGSGYRIYRANLDGTDREVVIDETGILTKVALDGPNAEIYFGIDSGGHRAIEKADLDGSNRTVLIEREWSVLDVSLDLPNARIYWIESTSGNPSDLVYRADLDGTNVEAIVDGLVQLGAVAVQPEEGDGGVVPATSAVGAVILVGAFLLASLLWLRRRPA